MEFGIVTAWAKVKNRGDSLENRPRRKYPLVGICPSKSQGRDGWPQPSLSVVVTALSCRAAAASANTPNQRPNRVARLQRRLRRLKFVTPTARRPYLSFTNGAPAPPRDRTVRNL